MEAEQQFERDNLDQSIEIKQYSTFFVGGRWYGIDVMKVQEVLKYQPLTIVPRSPKYVKGLINLRGQIATAIELWQLFGIEEYENHEDKMNVVCKVGDNLISLSVDSIGDVVEVSQSKFEKTPDTISTTVRKFMEGVYKLDGPLLSIIDVDKIIVELNNMNRQ